ncbi:hypothetical protein ACLKA6_007395 [Drosophila palustris]
MSAASLKSSKLSGPHYVSVTVKVRSLTIIASRSIPEDVFQDTQHRRGINNRKNINLQSPWSWWILPRRLQLDLLDFWFRINTAKDSFFKLSSLTSHYLKYYRVVPDKFEVKRQISATGQDSIINTTSYFVPGKY